MPVQPSKQRLVGRWRVVWQCGTEEIRLDADSTYTQDIQYATGGHATHAGTWIVEPKESHLEGAHVILQDGMEFCSAFGGKLPQPQRGNRRLETIWEWGRVILSFNPDMDGFERQ